MDYQARWGKKQYDFSWGHATVESLREEIELEIGPHFDIYCEYDGFGEKITLESAAVFEGLKAFPGVSPEEIIAAAYDQTGDLDSALDFTECLEYAESVDDLVETHLVRDGVKVNSDAWKSIDRDLYLKRISSGVGFHIHDGNVWHWR